MGEELLNKEGEKAKIIWDLIYILFSVTLSFTVYNGFETNLFAPGKIIIYYLFGDKSIEPPTISTIIFGMLVIVNVLILAYIHNKEYIEHMSCLYIKYLEAFLIGISPAIFWYLLLIIAHFIGL